MENYQVLQEALDKATQRGAFALQETAAILNALAGTRRDLDELKTFRDGKNETKELSLVNNSNVDKGLKSKK